MKYKMNLNVVVNIILHNIYIMIHNNQSCRHYLYNGMDLHEI